MDRRKFLRKTSSGALAAALLPLLSFKESSLSKKDQYSVRELYKKNGKEWLISIIIIPDILTQFKESGDENKEVVIETFDETSIPSYYKILALTEKTVDGKNLHFLSCRLQNDKTTSENYNFAKELFGKQVEIEIHDKCHAVIRNEKMDLKINLGFEKTSESQCFLTSACVFHKNLPDNCYELTTLRALRENVMKPHPEYQKLISEYNIIAPQMLVKINKASNKNEILDHIYSHLVLPSVSLIESGKNEEAIEYYGNFVNEMKYLYL